MKPMRDTIRYPSKIVWAVVGLFAFLCALLLVLVPSSRRETSPPYDLRLFFVAPPEQGFSIESALKKMKLNPDDITLLLKIQHYYAYEGEWEKVVETGKKIVLSPKGEREGIAYLGITYALIYLGKVEEAEKWIAEGLQKVANSQQRAQLHRAAGDISLLRYEAQKRYYYLSMAETEYRRALQEWPEYSFAHANLAYVKFKQGNFTTARQIISKVFHSPEATARDRAVATYYLAQIEQVSGNATEAERLYNKARQIHPESFIQSSSNRNP
jgi:tetratricopeptide (TPR) repeat protein